MKFGNNLYIYLWSNARLSEIMKARNIWHWPEADCEDITGKTKILDTIPEEYEVKLSFDEDYNPDMLDDMKEALKSALYESR